jgi:SAM-dependent methyltransferase
MVYLPELGGRPTKLTSKPGYSESISSSSVASLGYRTIAMSSKPSSSHSGGRPYNNVVSRNGRTYLRDITQAYPLPVDLQEMHRQSLRTLLLIQVFGSPMMALDDADRPPRRVLDVGCGSGFWSMMCHRHLKARGLDNVSFVGVDVVPLSPGSVGHTGKPDPDMQWQFVQHDIRQAPFPFADDEFDHIQINDMCLATPSHIYQIAMEEYMRILRPGGTLELWETDSTIRMLRPHVPESAAISDSDSDDDESAHVDENGGSSSNNTNTKSNIPPMGVYNISGSTPLSAPLNPYFVEFNGWIVRALEARHLTAVPCTLMGPMLLQETDVLRDVRSRRLAIPLSEVRWEREGVGGVVTKDGKSYVDWRGKYKSTNTPAESTTVSIKGTSPSPSVLAIRRTALLSVVQLIQSLEPLLREASGKSQDEWDGWLGKMTADVMREGGTSWGECMETGAWWCKKR